jgi:ribosome-associated toxin RatA of RatAB toxin-antitoxin module
MEETACVESPTAMTKFRMLTLCALVFVATALPASAQAGDLVITAELRDGSIVSSRRAQAGTSVERGRAMVVIDAPADRVYDVIQNYGLYKEFLPNFETSRVLSQRGASALLYVQVSIMRGAKTIWAELKLKPRKVSGETRVIEAKLLKGNVDYFEALWEVTPISDTQTLVGFEIMVDPDLPLPAGFVSAENQKSARKTLRALRERLSGVKHKD